MLHPPVPVHILSSHILGHFIVSAMTGSLPAVEPWYVQLVGKAPCPHVVVNLGPVSSLGYHKPRSHEEASHQHDFSSSWHPKNSVQLGSLRNHPGPAVASQAWGAPSRVWQRQKGD